MYKMRFYVSGSESNISQTILVLKNILKESLKSQYSLEIINVLENPEWMKPIEAPVKI